MSSNKKVALTSAVLILLIIITGASIIAIFAAAQQTVNSEVSVTYKSEYVSGTASAKYYVGEEDKEGTPMRVNGEAEGETTIEFNSRNSTQTQTLSPVEKEIKLSEENYFVVFEYYFTNTNSQNDYMATLTTSESNVKNMTVTTATSDSIIEDYSTIKDPVQNVEQLKIEQLISASSNGFVYVRVEITNPDNDADFKINFNWDLKKYSVEPTLDKLNFVQSGEFYEVSIAPDAEGEVIVPATYMGKQVKIAEPQEGGSYLGGHEDKYTFTGSFTNLKNVTKVTLMKGITEIPAKAFIVDFTKDEDASVKIMQVLNSSDLQEIVIPDSVTTIGAWAFWCCQNLTTVTLGKGAKTSEESYIFSGCSALENIFYTGTVEEWISNISPICRDRENYYGISDPYVNLFTKEGLLTSYTFTNNIEIIPFCSIKSLQTLTIGSEVTSIKTYDVCDFSRSISLNEIILDSETIYNEIKYVSSVEYLTNNLQSGSGTIKVLNTIDATSNSYVTSNFTLSGTEDIGGKTYNVYTKN